jgi:sporulation protein YlmC with PRC-barrel domain
VGTAFRQTLSARSLIDTKVVNSSGEDLGKIEELMINIDTGTVAYAVLSFGGFLGIGDKLFAVPWSSLFVDEINEQIVLNKSREELRRAPGFDKDHWPDFTADMGHMNEVNKFYSATSAGTSRTIL